MRRCTSHDSELYNTTRKGPLWENVKRVVHIDIATNKIIFDEVVNENNRRNEALWNKSVDAPSGLITFLHYTGELGKPKTTAQLESLSAKRQRRRRDFAEAD